MSLYDKASLVQIPSGTKSGTLYSVLPADGDGDFTHTRASSATRVNKNGLIESVASGVPRLNYPLLDGVVQSCPALLLEPSRTNSLFYSEELDNSTYYTHTNCTVTSASGTAPDGSNNARKLQDTVDTVNTTHNIQAKSAYVGTIAYDSIKTGSVFVKAGTKKFVQVRLTNLAGTFSYVMGNFDLENEAILTGASANASDVSYDLENYGNGWYRCIVRGAWTDSSVTKTGMQVLMADKNSNSTQMHNYIGDGTGTLFVWGGQIEEGSYETSYIPTSGSTVTRNADVCDSAGTSAEFNDSEGVLFVEARGLNDTDTGNRYISITDGTAANSVMIQFRNNGELRTYNGGTGSSNTMFLEDIDLTETQKIAIKYGNSTSDYRLYLNGFQKTLYSLFSATPVTGLDELRFRYAPSGGSDFYGKTKQLMVFNQALTDSELEQVTSWTSFGEMAKGQLYTIE